MKILNLQNLGTEYPAYNIATPADWQPGDDVIVPPADSCGVPKERMDAKIEGVTCSDWFFCTKPLTIEKIKMK